MYKFLQLQLNHTKFQVQRKRITEKIISKNQFNCSIVKNKKYFSLECHIFRLIMQFDMKHSVSTATWLVRIKFKLSRKLYGAPICTPVFHIDWFSKFAYPSESFAVHFENEWRTLMEVHFTFGPRRVARFITMFRSKCIIAGGETRNTLD